MQRRQTQQAGVREYLESNFGSTQPVCELRNTLAVGCALRDCCDVLWVVLVVSHALGHCQGSPGMLAQGLQQGCCQLLFESRVFGDSCRHRPTACVIQLPDEASSFASLCARIIKPRLELQRCCWHSVFPPVPVCTYPFLIGLTWLVWLICMTWQGAYYTGDGQMNPATV